MRFKIISLVLISIFGIVGVLGFWGFSHIVYDGYLSCPFGAFSGGECHSVTNALALLIHHISGLKSVIEATSISANSLLAAVFLLTVALATFFFEPPRSTTIRQRIFLPQQHFWKLSIGEPNQRLVYWLTLHNKRDPHPVRSGCMIMIG